MNTKVKVKVKKRNIITMSEEQSLRVEEEKCYTHLLCLKSLVNNANRLT